MGQPPEGRLRACTIALDAAQRFGRRSPDGELGFGQWSRHEYLLRHEPAALPRPDAYERTVLGHEPQPGPGLGLRFRHWLDLLPARDGGDFVRG